MNQKLAELKITDKKVKKEIGKAHVQTIKIGRAIEKNLIMTKQNVRSVFRI